MKWPTVEPVQPCDVLLHVEGVGRLVRFVRCTHPMPCPEHADVPRMQQLLGQFELEVN